MSEQVKLRFYDIKDGEDSILLTDGKIGTFADRTDFIERRSPIEKIWGVMVRLGAVRPLEVIEATEGNRDQWVEVDGQANPLQ